MADSQTPPVGCIRQRVDLRTVYLRGRPINVKEIARVTGVDQGYLSKILNGRRSIQVISVDCAMRIAAALGMGLEDLIDAVRERNDTDFREYAELRAKRESRLHHRMRLERAAARTGKPIPPQIQLKSLHSTPPPYGRA